MVGTPSEKEEEYIKRQELEKIKKLREQAAKDTAEQEKKDLKEQHWMRCPKCGMELDEVDYKNVVVDACFACGGMFFDHGEIDKILEQEDSGSVLGKVVSGLFGSGSK
jgi:protein-arginine kinase activator protein McsA